MTVMTTPITRMPSVEPISDASPPGGVGVVCCIPAAPATGADASDGLKFVNARMPMRITSRTVIIPKLEIAFIVVLIAIVSWRQPGSWTGAFKSCK